MVRNTRIKQKHPRLATRFFLISCLLICVSALFFNTAHTAAANDEIKRNFDKKLNAHVKHQKKALEKHATDPFDARQQRLLKQLLATEGTLEEVLSTPEYLRYLNLKIGTDALLSTPKETKRQQRLAQRKSENQTDVRNYSALLAKMPTPEQSKEALLAFRDLLPEKLTDEEQQEWQTLYFKIRKIYTDPHTFIFMSSPSLLRAQTEFVYRHTEDWKTPAEKKVVLAEVRRLSMHCRAPNRTARVVTQVYHDTWHKHLKQYGAREGLLRSAIATPSEFALTRSFFENTEVFEKWIQTSLKPSDNQKKQIKKTLEKWIQTPPKDADAQKTQNKDGDTSK